MFGDLGGEIPARLRHRAESPMLRRSPGNVVNRVALAVRTAWEVFPECGIEREFIKAVFKFVGRRHSLRLWESSMP